jgi:hypothetical protein
VTQALSHLRTSRRRLALLVVPALLLRALIPVGFMPFAGAGGLSIGLCPGAAELPPGVSTPAPHAGQTGHTHHHGGGSGDTGTPHHPACLFSAGVATVFAAALTAPALVAPALTALDARVAPLVFLPAILRAQSPRGPPVPA